MIVGGIIDDWKFFYSKKEFLDQINMHSKKINKEVIKKALRMMPTKEIEGFFIAKIKKKL